MKTVSLFVLIVGSLLASAESLSEPRIVNGENAQEGQFPYEASLRKLNNDHLCSASILSGRFLLTAAHCFLGMDLNPKTIYAVVGAVNLKTGGTKVTLNKIISHKDFSLDTHSNDIALVRSVKSIIFTDVVQPIALPKQNLPDEGNVNVFVSGWGRISKIVPGCVDKLQFLETQTISRKECQKRLNVFPGLIKAIHNQTVCAYKPNAGACVGDSGGPLVETINKKDNILVGILTYSYLCGEGYPDVFTRVHSYLDWIQENVDEQSFEAE